MQSELSFIIRSADHPGAIMRRTHDWQNYASQMSEQKTDPVQYTNLYARQWAHDVRCGHSGVTHRRVGESAHRNAHEDWLQAGFVAQQKPRSRG